MSHKIIGGSPYIEVSTYTTNTTINGTEGVVLINNAGNTTITLLPANNMENECIYIRKIDGGGANTVTIQPDGSDTIDAASTLTLQASGNIGVHIVSDGTGWWVLSKY